MLPTTPRLLYAVFRVLIVYSLINECQLAAFYLLISDLAWLIAGYMRSTGAMVTSSPTIGRSQTAVLIAYSVIAKCDMTCWTSRLLEYDIGARI
ncbi:hypothetical protein F4824DRAFT_440471 [Ustulina deusta]|nr:hypothetical protein F4824DRAFT_440471 [Ustulina deusta]